MLTHTLVCTRRRCSFALFSSGGVSVSIPGGSTYALGAGSVSGTMTSLLS